MLVSREIHTAAPVLRIMLKRLDAYPIRSRGTVVSEIADSCGPSRPPPTPLSITGPTTCHGLTCVVQCDIIQVETPMDPKATRMSGLVLTPIRANCPTTISDMNEASALGDSVSPAFIAV